MALWLGGLCAAGTSSASAQATPTIRTRSAGSPESRARLRRSSSRAPVRAHPRTPAAPAAPGAPTAKPAAPFAQPAPSDSPCRTAASDGRHACRRQQREGARRTDQPEGRAERQRELQEHPRCAADPARHAAQRVARGDEPDRTIPTVGIAVYYDVGSRNEVKGRSGFAHLFEHMMFQGSANVAKGEHFQLILNRGGQMNGTTSEDRTKLLRDAAFQRAGARPVARSRPHEVARESRRRTSRTSGRR